MAKYRNNSFIVDAIEWDGKRLAQPVPEWVGPALAKGPEEMGAMFRLGDCIHCWSRFGRSIAGPGNIIAFDVKSGEITAWGKGLFHQCHVPVEDRQP